MSQRHMLSITPLIVWGNDQSHISASRRDALSTQSTMKKTSRLLLLTTLAIIATACHSSKKTGELSFSIEGTLDNAAGKTLYIEEMTPDNGPQFIDSIECDKKGHFKFKGSTPYQTFFNLHASEYDYIVLLPEDGDDIEISGDCQNLTETYMVKNSKESQLMWQIQSYINVANNAIADIAAQDRENRDQLSGKDYEKAHKVTDSIFIAEHNTVYLMFYNFIEDNAGSLSTLYAIDAPFNHTGRVFYPEPDFEVFEQVLAGLEEKNPDNPHTQYYRTRIERARSARLLSQQ